ncbi:replicative DNA helicase [Brasilonema sp. UFV-L1]|uniref:replicative DNA helicase n=1 Tax=Brasilonema sp. UFV-L1 TaxID=2234130 RepID=UPI00145E83FC|nr:replicative DNA helicase [Brasilonema sp. UFV-L1]NMG09378.1 replicative DNA helicase [Brasilonema sp. UFV-L1]
MSEELNFQSQGLDRLPPQNIEAEESILGGILLDPEAISRVNDRLIPEAFYLNAHKDIYQAIIKLHNQGKPTDLLAVINSLNDHDMLERVGGRNKLITLVDRTVSAVNIDALADLVMDKYLRRQLIKAGNEIVHLGYQTDIELPKILDQTEQKIFSITQKRPKTGLVHISNTLIHTFQDIETRHQGIALPGIPCGFYDLDAMTSGFQRSDLIIVAGRPSMGKCVAYNTEILLADGSVSTIEEIYHRHHAQLLTLGKDWKFHVTQPSAFVDDQIKPVFRVTTRLGRYVETTITHPYLTINGWRPLSELIVGDQIAVPRKINLFGTQKIRECEVKLLAYFIGNGCLTDTTPKFTNINPLIQQDFTHAVISFSPQLKVRLDTRPEYSPTLYALKCQGRKNPITEWLRNLGLWGKKAHEKIIPALIFQLECSQISLFLNRLFATDGWATVVASGQVQLGYFCVSEKLARQIQHLLLRFGIIAALKKCFVKYKKTRIVAWQLEITDAQSIKIFSSEIGILGKETDLLQVQAALINKRYQTNSDHHPVEIWEEITVAKGEESWAVLARRSEIKGYTNIHVDKHALSGQRLLSLASALEDLYLQELATGDVYWDEIVSIESVGDKQVYDLTIPITHNFIANDICVHNTALCLNVAHNVAASYKLPVGVFSLEMSKEQLAQRLLASEAEIETGYLRSGRISQTQWEPLSRAIGMLSDMPIYIDDTPNITVTEMRSQARQLQAKLGTELGLIVIDYLQLMEGAGDNRVQELSRITRSLKSLARELSVPVIALSQLSRGVEARTNKRPMLSDLRESGCLSGESLVTLAHSGMQVPIRELVGKSGFTVWALNEVTMQIEQAVVSNAFSTGVKPVLKLMTRLGRTIRATANHKFLTIHGWRQLDELQIGDSLALPRCLPSSCVQSMSNSEIALLGHLIGDGCTLPRHIIQYTTREEDLANTVATVATTTFGERVIPRISKERDWYQVYLSAGYRLTHKVRNPVAEWLDSLGVFGLRSYEKFVPNPIFEQPQESIALFLRHLWSTDGCIKPSKGKCPYPAIYYTSSSEKLSKDVQSLLIRLDINAKLSVTPQPNKGRHQYQVWVTGKSDIVKFTELIGAVGIYKKQALKEIAEYIEVRSANTNRDIIPHDIWKLYAVPSMQQHGITIRQMQSSLGVAHCGTTLYKQNLSRERAARLGTVVKSEEINLLANSDVYWDTIISIEADGEEEVYDLTVPKHHNFIANNIIVHNSIEQDADLVLMLYRDDYYNSDSVDRGIAEVIIAKHRNGPTGIIKLLFDPQYTKFKNLAKPNHY